jgi:hypothetical protein
MRYLLYSFETPSAKSMDEKDGVVCVNANMPDGGESE